MGFSSNSTTNADVIKPNMDSISKEVLKKCKMDLKQEDKYFLNLQFACEDLPVKDPTSQEENKSAEYFVVISMLVKDKKTLSKKIIGCTERGIG